MTQKYKYCKYIFSKSTKKIEEGLAGPLHLKNIFIN
jgi:hypothetical protein